MVRPRGKIGEIAHEVHEIHEKIGKRGLKPQMNTDEHRS